MEFSRQEYWSESPHPPPGHLPDSGIEPMSLASPASAGSSFPLAPTWEAHCGLHDGAILHTESHFPRSLPQTSPDSLTMSHCRHDPNPAERCPHPKDFRTVFSPMTPCIIPLSPVPVPSGLVAPGRPWRDRFLTSLSRSLPNQ